MTDETCDNTNLLPRRTVLYCAKCGMPPEYCEFGPDFEKVCDPWLAKHHPEVHAALAARRGSEVLKKPKAKGPEENDEKDKPPKPDSPWTTAQRLTAFYEKYVPEKLEAIPGLLEKYAGKEEKLFQALTQKYGPEPLDPYYSDSEEEDDDDGDDDDGDDDDDDEEENEDAEKVKTTSKRRGAAAKASGSDTFTGRVLVQKQAQKKKRCLTVITGLEPALAINHHKLKDATKAFSKRFAGSSSVKDDAIILQGDHVLELAEMLVDKFQVPEEAVYVDMGDGEALPLRG